MLAITVSVTGWSTPEARGATAHVSSSLSAGAAAGEGGYRRPHGKADASNHGLRQRLVDTRSAGRVTLGKHTGTAVKQYESFLQWRGGKVGGKGLAAGFPPNFPPKPFENLAA